MSTIHSHRAPSGAEPDRLANGCDRYRVGSLLTIGANPKLIKSDKAGAGYLTAVLHLAPSTLSGYNVCPYASAICRQACLHSAGNPAYWENKQAARLARTRLFIERRPAFLERLTDELTAFNAKCKAQGLRAAVRLNGTSDIRWERVAPDLFTRFDDVRFYDYTKDAQRLRPGYRLPENYGLTFSRSESNERTALRLLAGGRNVAVVFGGFGRIQPLPTTWRGFDVIDGDKHDLRFLDPAGVVVGLRAKGKARDDRTSGFVVWP